MDHCYRYTTIRETLNEPVPTIKTAKEMVAWITKKAYPQNQSFRETATAVFLNNKNQIIGYEIMSIGLPDQCIIDKKNNLPHRHREYGPFCRRCP